MMDELLTIYKDRLSIMCILCSQSHSVLVGVNIKAAGVGLRVCKG